VVFAGVESSVDLFVVDRVFLQDILSTSLSVVPQDSSMLGCSDCLCLSNQSRDDERLCSRRRETSVDNDGRERLVLALDANVLLRSERCDLRRKNSRTLLSRRVRLNRSISSNVPCDDLSHGVLSKQRCFLRSVVVQRSARSSNVARRSRVHALHSCCSIVRCCSLVSSQSTDDRRTISSESSLIDNFIFNLFVL
jgi:hypothetical protein